MNLKNWTRLLGIAVLAAALSPAVTQAQNLEKMKIQHYAGSMISLVTYIGLDQNIFKKHGLDVQLVATATGPDATAALLSGGVDLMLNSGDNMLRALDKGSPAMKVLVGNVREMPFSVVVSNDVTLPPGNYQEAMKGLAGKRLGVLARGSSSEMIFRALVSASGLNPDKDVTWIAVGGLPTAIPAFQTKLIDAYLGFEPFQTAMTSQKVGRVVLDMRKSQGPAGLVNFPYNFYIARADSLTSKPDTMRKLAAALTEAHAFMQSPANLNAVVKSASRFISIEESLLRQMVINDLPVYSPVVSEAGMNKWIAFSQSALGVKREFTPAELVATGYIPKN